MRRRAATLRIQRWLGAVAGVLLLAPPAAAFEFLDGRLQVHGFFEQQVRALGRDFSLSDDIDLAQWYHVLNVEIEYDVAPDGWGPFDLVSTFARLEGRYDCVWSRGCGLLRSADAYGDRAEHLPKRVNDSRRSGFSGALFLGDTRGYAGVPRSQQDTAFADVPRPGNTRTPLQFFQTPGWSILFGIAGPDQALGTGDDPAPFTFEEVLRNCLFSARAIPGPNGGRDPLIAQGPWNPGCKLQPIGRLRTKPHPLNPQDLNPILLGADRTPGTGDELPGVSPFGSGELPFQPAPLFRADGTPRTDVGPVPSARAREWDAQGVYVPSAGLRQLLRGGELDAFDQNFRQAELEWNRGASQQDEKELKELYVDLEMFEGRLWMRAGKQSIVWGKTELFRTTDQFNPQDLALASLPSLEESRVGLWSLRGVWSFYEVGPLEDLRLELAMNYDQFEPSDLGRCGEPFTANPVCGKTFGLFAHGLSGVGLAGELRPPDPWNDGDGIEVGARLEWRWGRFSFQLSNFYGFSDFPFPELVFGFERNVDPLTGRPRRLNSRAGCDLAGDTSGCLGVLSNPAAPSNPFTDLDGDGNADRTAGDDGLLGNLDDPVAIPDALRIDVLENHSVNQWLFAMVCSTSFGASDIDPNSCGQNIFGSRDTFLGLFSLANLIGGLLAGSPGANTVVRDPAFAGIFLPLVQLNSDPGDNTPGSDAGDRPNPLAFVGDSLSQRLTPEQEALLGCGPFYGTHCDLDGIALGNLEASAVMQSWPGFEGTFGDWEIDGRPQAGTVDFVQSGATGSPCTRFENGRLFVLPGCRGPWYDAATLRELYGIQEAAGAWDPDVDGCPASEATLLAAGVDAARAARCGLSNGGAGANDLVIPATDIDGPGPFGDIGPAIGQPFASEMAALSWNFLMTLVAFSLPRDFDGDGAPDGPLTSEFDRNDPFGDRAENACGLLKPHFCFGVIGLYNLAGVQHNTVRAGGNQRFGRRDWTWHSGSTSVLRYDKRNVLGFALDWAEDRTKTNWGLEATWIDDTPMVDQEEFDRLTTVDSYNLTISVDRPSFIHFLNPNRTFLFNSQWFIQYVDGYKQSFISNGPINVLATFTIFTGYFQDRLLILTTGLYDFKSNSGGFLPQVIYRFTENFSASVGVNAFFGRFESKDAPVRSIGPQLNRAGKSSYKSFWENGVSPIRDRDEVYLKVRYTF